MVEADKSFKKMFPHLAKELSNGENAVSIDSVEPSPEDAETQAEIQKPDKFHNYVPTVVDFIRRCNTEREADEIIAYLEKRCEISRKSADKLKKQLKEKGVRSFGAKKAEDYYFKESGLC